MSLFFEKYVKSLASLCALLILSFSFQAHLYAQQGEPDYEAPLIEHDAFEFSGSDPVQVFTANVADNIGLRSVILFYRFDNKSEFNEEEMKQLAESSVYTASVPVESHEGSTIEYYIQAEDQAGNVVLKGYAFAPLERVLAQPATAEPVATSNKLTAEKPKSKILYYVLGAVAIGALVGLSGGGSDDEKSEPCDPDNGCRVTFTTVRP